jgi:glycosyltransferase involved in cell wall biosynthesis
MRKAKFCVSTMFKNEAHCIRQMLESLIPYVDYYVFQDNGSTDGTPEIVTKFFEKHNIPGFVYKVEEGWVNPGWNRDHLLQTTLRANHGCDWIIRMDCDEYLEVDSSIDWSIFEDTSIDSFNVTSILGSCIYYRTWIWNAKLPWKFYHSLSHECIYMDSVGEGFQRVSAPIELKMIGTFNGESYATPYKYVLDGLKKEVQLLTAGTMTQDLYNLWYIGKSYFDGFSDNTLPFGNDHVQEYARRGIFYFQQFIKTFVQLEGEAESEQAYLAHVYTGRLLRVVGRRDEAVSTLEQAEKFCPDRNDHIVELAYHYQEIGDYDKMLQQTTRLMEPERVMPFPKRSFLILRDLYHNSGSFVKELHSIALEKATGKKIETTSQEINQDSHSNIMIPNFNINIKPRKRLFVAENFYEDPFAVRNFALQQEFKDDIRYYKGKRTEQQIVFAGTKEAFESVMGMKITNWAEYYPMCGRFQSCVAEDAIVYHTDEQQWAGMIYLTPNAPFTGGTATYANKITKARHVEDPNYPGSFDGGFYDGTKFEPVDIVGNVFNRLVIFDAKCIHSPYQYFGRDLESSRLFHMFFFDAE